MKPIYLFSVLSVLLFTACIDQIDFDRDSNIQDLPLIVRGKVTHGNGPYYLRIGRFSGKEEIQVENAEVYLLNGNGEREAYLSLGEGLYENPGEIIKGETGEIYQVEIVLATQRYISRPEVMPAPAKVDDFSLELVDKERVVNGGVLVQKFMDVKINTTLPDVKNGPYVRWITEEAWKLTETQSPNPLARPKSCYFVQNVDPQSIRLFNGKEVLTRKLENYTLLSRIVDWSFEERHVFTIYQSTITEEAYDYWRDVNLVINQNGSIFDSPPSALPGNIYNTSDSLEVVLGYFEAAAIDTARFPVFKTDLAPFRVPERCFTLWTDYPFGARIPRECYNCLLIDGASLVRPDGF